MGDQLLRYRRTSGFTLIEMSIVLVIIGLIVGGVLVGQDLIRAAYVRAQISQIEKFNTAVNTFFGKYQALPGDMNNSTAVTYGFSAATHNSGASGAGDGNGIIDGGLGGPEIGTDGGVANQSITDPTAFGETGVFWVDLSGSVAGNLIEGGFSAAKEGGPPITVSIAQMSEYVPAAKLGSGNYVYVIEMNGTNYFGIENISVFGVTAYGAAGMTVSQAYNIDRKIDDGFPTTGNVAAMVTYPGHLNWVLGGETGSEDTYVPSGSVFSGTGSGATAAGPTTCFDGNIPPVYSMEINGGAGLNCALIIKMQGGD